MTENQNQMIERWLAEEDAADAARLDVESAAYDRAEAAAVETSRGLD